MKIVLVHPAGSNWMPGKKDITATANRMAPLGLLSIASFLENQGHDVFIHDCLGPNAPLGIKANAKIILDYKPDLAGFSATTSGFLDGYDLATEMLQWALKVGFPKCTVLADSWFCMGPFIKDLKHLGLSYVIETKVNYTVKVPCKKPKLTPTGRVSKKQYDLVALPKFFKSFARGFLIAYFFHPENFVQRSQKNFFSPVA